MRIGEQGPSGPSDYLVDPLHRADRPETAAAVAEQGLGFPEDEHSARAQHLGETADYLFLLGAFEVDEDVAAEDEVAGVKALGVAEVLLTELVAETFGLAPSDVTILSGETSPDKVVRLALSPREAAVRCQSALLRSAP